jgi:hypothetical protein
MVRVRDVLHTKHAHPRSFADARDFVRRLGLKTVIPTAPGQVYKHKGWQGMGDWLGTGTTAPNLRAYRLFAYARAFVRTLNLRSGAEWSAYCKSGALPSDIPANASRVYASMGWKGIGDWLGTGRLSNRDRGSRFRSFADARAYARNLGLKSIAEWHAFRRQDAFPDDIPTNPNIAYRSKGWDCWGDWLGTTAESKPKRSSQEP